ncbi:MAG: glutamine-hydrolyzing GMP synthase [Lentisphaeria bacterium]|jgi:GMP synthase (glutamine-hydrolysing)
MKQPPQTILVLDFGSQYTQLIARRIREAHVYSEIVDSAISVEAIRKHNPAGLILSGGPASVHQPGAPSVDPRIFELGLPILGICYGLQLMAKLLGGEVKRAGSREYGAATLTADTANPLFAGIPAESGVWMSHADEVVKLPRGFQPIAESGRVPNTAVWNGKKRFWGVQFHPEVVHTKHGKRMLRNFVRGICGCQAKWTPRAYVAQAVETIRNQVGDAQVVCGLSGGVDSAVAALLIHKAIGDRLTCIFVDNGLLRWREADKLMEVFAKKLRVRVKKVDAADHFLDCLAGVTEPERKRKVIGHEFITVFKQAAKGIPNAHYLAQGTLYPDVIESSGIGKHAEVIKSHHNVGGLPKELGFKLVEPLRMLFKDEVRALGKELGMDEEMIWRQPFPGPGLAVRCLGEITRAKLDILREADRIVGEEIKKAGWYRRVWQSFAVLLPIQSVGVQGDGRSYDFTCVIRAVHSSDGMTADWVPLPHALLARISTRITNEVKGINRVAYDITSKPPSTIEWE